MAFTSFGYDGTVTEEQFAEGIARLGSSLYGVAGASDWRVSIAAGTRTVSVAVGSGWGPGVHDTTDAVETLSLSAASSGERWDLVVARRNWSTNTTTFEVVEGGSAMTIPAGREVTPGTLDDQPLAFVKVNTTAAIQQIVDLRVWVGGGGVVAVDEAVLQYLNEPGTEVLIGDTRWTRRVNGSYGVEWVTQNVYDTGWVEVPVALTNGFAGVAGQAVQVRKVGKQVTLRGAVRRTTGDPQNGMAVVPAGYRPSRGTTYMGGYRTSTGNWEGILAVSPNGLVQTVFASGSIQANAIIPFFGTWFTD